MTSSGARKLQSSKIRPKPTTAAVVRAARLTSASTRWSWGTARRDRLAGAGGRLGGSGGSGSAATAGGGGGRVVVTAGDRFRWCRARRRRSAADQPAARLVSVPRRTTAPSEVGPPVAPAENDSTASAPEGSARATRPWSSSTVAAPVSTTRAPLTPVAPSRPPASSRPDVPRGSRQASASRSASTWGRPAPNPLSEPLAVTTRTRSWRRLPATRMLAAARHHPLEALRCVDPGPVVEDDGGAALPGELVLADHELVVAGGGRPVHPPQVVADDVGAQGVEVLAAAPEGVGVLGARQRIVAGAERQRRAGARWRGRRPARTPRRPGGAAGPGRRDR